MIFRFKNTNNGIKKFQLKIKKKKNPENILFTYTNSSAFISRIIEINLTVIHYINICININFIIIREQIIYNPIKILFVAQHGIILDWFKRLNR